MGLNLTKNSIIYVDTCIFIYTVESDPNYWSLIQPLWKNLQDGNIKIITSELTLMEVLVFPLKNNDNQLVEDYKTFLTSSNIELKPINQSILTEGARLRGITNLKTPDAIHLATALLEKCDIFLTNDLGFRKVTDISILILDQVLNS